MNSKPEAKKESKENKKIRKQVIKVISELANIAIKKDVGDEKALPSGRISPVPDQINLRECMNVFGTLINDTTKERSLITAARIEYFPTTQIIHYTTISQDLFKSFPCPATYLGPFVESKKVFVEVLAKIGEGYLCRPVANLEYLGLLNTQGGVETSAGQ